MINANEIMKGSILCHEGKSKRVVAIGDYIQFEGLKCWIGGSMVEEEPLTEAWIETLEFVKDGGRYYFADPTSSRIIWLKIYGPGRWIVEYSVNEIDKAPLRVITSVHQLQMLVFSIIGEHLKVPKLPKK